MKDKTTTLYHGAGRADKTASELSKQIGSPKPSQQPSRRTWDESRFTIEADESRRKSRGFLEACKSPRISPIPSVDTCRLK